MPHLEKLYKKFKNSPNNIRYSDLCKLAELVGFKESPGHKGRGTSHKIYVHENPPGRMTFQAVKGKAKPYQVRQLIDFIDMHDLIILGEKK